MARLSTSKARQNLSDAIDLVRFTRERVTLHRNGKDVAALIPMEDLALLRRLEDETDIAAARKALAAADTVAWDEVKSRLGISARPRKSAGRSRATPVRRANRPRRAQGT